MAGSEECRGHSCGPRQVYDIVPLAVRRDQMTRFFSAQVARSPGNIICVTLCVIPSFYVSYRISILKNIWSLVREVVKYLKSLSFVLTKTVTNGSRSLGSLVSPGPPTPATS